MANRLSSHRFSLTLVVPAVLVLLCSVGISSKVHKDLYSELRATALRELSKSVGPEFARRFQAKGLKVRKETTRHTWRGGFHDPTYAVSGEFDNRDQSDPSNRYLQGSILCFIEDRGSDGLVIRRALTSYELQGR